MHVTVSNSYKMFSLENLRVGNLDGVIFFSLCRSFYGDRLSSSGSVIQWRRSFNMISGRRSVCKRCFRSTAAEHGFLVPVTLHFISSSESPFMGKGNEGTDWLNLVMVPTTS